MEEAFNINSLFIPSIMMIEIYFVEFLLSIHHERKKNFWLKFISYSLVSIYLVVLTIFLYNLFTGNGFEYGKIPESFNESIFNFLLYLTIFIMVTIVYLLSFKQSLVSALSCCSIAYAIQHIIKNATEIICLYPPFSGKIAYFIINFLLFLICCILLYFLFVKKQFSIPDYKGKSKSKLFISLFVIFICIGMSRITSDNYSRNTISLIAESLYAIVCCFLVLYIQLGIVENDTLHYEVDSMKEIIHEEKKQYELSKETIDLINIKCHDLKYQIAELRNNYSEKNLSSIEHAVMIYDCEVKTGNDVLDVILTEKKLQCENKNIDMTFSVKGENLSFLDTIDIYTLFGNLLSNAIESVSKIQEIEKRCISLNIINKENMIIIHLENYFQGKIDFKNDLPISSKNNDYHGFGMKSIQRIVKKYNGELSILTNNDIFISDIIFPIV